ncbi:MAG TPA: DNA-directed DNA polymerase II small subunit, partial [Candidatus Binatus sp.]|nr:DNA-directed DNA polymerase II small subunit [Candidatus Binatus sp.]
PAPVEEGHGGKRSFAMEVDSQLEVVTDPSGKLGTTGAFEDFLHYFRNRFEKMSRLLRQRMDTRSGGTIGDALSASANTKVRFICMIMDKRERPGKIFLTVDDTGDEATILATEHNQVVYQIAKRLLRDQVVFIEAKKTATQLFMAENIILPEVPDRRPTHSKDEVYAVLISDTHIGSKQFLREPFNRVLGWLNGDIGNKEQREVAGRVKYVLFGGDLVDGIGVYPRQEMDLQIVNIHDQYRESAKYVAQIPEHMSVVLIPGNHDAVRQALPQPMIPKEYAGPVYDSRHVVSLGDPSEIRVHGVHFLLYHGTSLMDLVSSVPGLEYQNPVGAMEYQLRMRHLAPEFGKLTPIGPEQEDYLVVDRVPDVFTSGHIHVSGYGVHRGVTMVNSGAWQGQTEYQKRMGVEPKPGLLPVINLKTLEVRMMNFLSS